MREESNGAVSRADSEHVELQQMILLHVPDGEGSPREAEEVLHRKLLPLENFSVVTVE